MGQGIADGGDSSVGMYIPIFMRIYKYTYIVLYIYNSTLDGHRWRGHSMADG